MCSDAFTFSKSALGIPEWREAQLQLALKSSQRTLIDRSLHNSWREWFPPFSLSHYGQVRKKFQRESTIFLLSVVLEKREGKEFILKYEINLVYR